MTRIVENDSDSCLSAARYFGFHTRVSLFSNASLGFEYNIPDGLIESPTRGETFAISCTIEVFAA